MRARLLVAAAALVATSASADPKPVPVDLKPIRDRVIVLQDAQGGTYVVLHSASERRVFFGTARMLHEQVVIGASADGDAWTVDTWAPRIAQMRPAYVEYKHDGSYFKSCDGKDDAVLAMITGDKAKQILDKAQFLSSAIVYRPHLLARDDGGIYYYVDKLAKEYGGNGYRVWAGKKGALKQLPLTNIASDSAGEVFSTKTGDLRLVRELDNSSKESAAWVKGERKTPLISLDTEVNSAVIFRELGIYGFTGTLCDNI